MKITDTARKYIGIKEIPPNAGWEDKQFEARMVACGWKPTFSWCALFAELVWKEAEVAPYEELNKLFSANSQQTFRNFKEAGYDCSMTPEEGAIMIWAYDGVKGHTAIVETVQPNYVYTIEGNSSDMVKRRRRVMSAETQLLGFIKPTKLEE